MRHRLIGLFAMALLVTVADGAPPTPAQTKGTQTTGATGLVARGDYIVNGLCRCTRCHTPLTASGERDRSRWLKGAPVQIRPTYKGPDWALVAPRLAGGPPGTDEQFIREMTTGISRTGERLRQPMPQFRMTRPDAEAVLAYLKSLPK